MKKRYLLIGAAIAGTAMFLAKHKVKVCRIEVNNNNETSIVASGRKKQATAILDFAAEKTATGWNPLSLVRKAKNKDQASEKMAEYILDLFPSDDVLATASEYTLLSSIICYVETTKDNTLPHVYDILAEMASLGVRYKYPEGFRKPEIRIPLSEEAKQNIADDLLQKLEILGCEKHKDILMSDSSLFEDVIKGRLRLRIVRDKEDCPLASLFENLAIGAFRGEF